jgi:triosephosphate isomerase
MMAARRPLVAGNWKMYKGVGETSAFLEALLQAAWPDAIDVVVCPPFTSLAHAAMLATGSRIGIGAQNVHWEDHGAFTGEIAAAMLVELGVGWVIVGHSERRTLFGETDDSTLARAARAQAHGLAVIYCIGESLAQRDAGDTFTVLDCQTAGLGKLDPGLLVVAYEPVWAIGTGRNATADQAQEAHAHIRRRLAGIFGSDAAGRLRILYGGSLKPANARELIGQPDVDGGLIGGASLDLDTFSDIMRVAAECAAGVGS